MMWLRKHWYLPFAALLIVFGVRGGYRSLSQPTLRQMHPAPPIPEEPTTEQPRVGEYNFTRMITLVDRTQVVKRQFKEQFKGFPSKHYKPVDMKETRNLLSDLYRERVRLNQHVLAMKAQHKGQIPEKRRKALAYYQGVVDECIGDIEKILRQV